MIKESKVTYSGVLRNPAELFRTISVTHCNSRCFIMCSFAMIQNCKEKETFSFGGNK